MDPSPSCQDKCMKSECRLYTSVECIHGESMKRCDLVNVAYRKMDTATSIEASISLGHDLRVCMIP